MHISLSCISNLSFMYNSCFLHVLVFLLRFQQNECVKQHTCISYNCMCRLPDGKNISKRQKLNKLQTFPNCLNRLIRAPFPNGLVMDAWNARVGNSADNSVTHLCCTWKTIILEVHYSGSSI